MKRLFRSRAVQAMLGWLVAAYTELLIVTLRWRFENRAPLDAAMAGPDGLIVIFWHGRIAQGMAARPILADKPRRVMISLSPDGDFIARAATLLRIPPVRGSTGREGASTKGGARAFREAVGFIRKGGVMILTPDGPRGPAERLPMGPLRMARTVGCPAYVMSLAASPVLTLKSWDRARIPLPFARAQAVLEGPLRLPEHADGEALEIARADWERRMRAGQARADALLAGEAR